MNISSIRERKFGNRTIFVTAIIVISLLIFDTALERISDLIGAPQCASYMRLSLFTAISIIAYGIAQYIILAFVNSRTKQIIWSAENASSIRFISSIKIIHRTVLIVQYLLTAILAAVILLMVFASHYYTALLTASTTISYALAIVLSGLLAQSFFRWFKSNRSYVVLSYGIASAAVAVSLIFSMAFMTAVLLSKPTDVMEHLTTIWAAFDPNSPMGVLNSAFVISSITAFMSMWISTALLLRHHSRKLGKIKYWSIIAIPLAYFLSQFVLPLFVDQVLTPLLSTDPIFMGIVFTLIFAVSKPAGGILFGIAFWAMARAIRHDSVVRDYMIISALGVVLLFVTTQGNVVTASYPPFGLVTVSFVGLSSYMMFIGLYSAAISVSEDVKLRDSIRKQILEETKLLDSIGSAHMEQEIVRRVMVVAKKNSAMLEAETGIQSSMEESDIKQYLEHVLNEVKMSKK
jgi:hypothetical protein